MKFITIFIMLFIICEDAYSSCSMHDRYGDFHIEHCEIYENGTSLILTGRFEKYLLITGLELSDFKIATVYNWKEVKPEKILYYNTKGLTSKDCSSFSTSSPTKLFIQISCCDTPESTGWCGDYTQGSEIINYSP